MNKVSIIFKDKAGWRCQRCGSSEFLAGHHQIPGDDTSIIVLCGECHSKEHPKIPKQLFFAKRTHPYWHNKSAASIARELGLDSGTIIRRAKRKGISPGLITTEQLEQIGYPKTMSVFNLLGRRGGKVIQAYNRDGGYPVLHIPSKLAKRCGIVPGSHISLSAYIKDSRLIIEQIKEDKYEST